MSSDPESAHTPPAAHSDPETTPHNTGAANTADEDRVEENSAHGDEAEQPPEAGAEQEHREAEQPTELAAEVPASSDVSGDEGVDDDVEDDEDDDEPEFEGHVEPIEEVLETPLEDLEFNWYILKVQVNREDSICDALRRRVAREGLEDYFRDIIVPTEDVVEFTKSGKKRTVKRKLYPGYIMVNMALTEDTWFLVRETPGIGDFTGSAGRPTPMDPEDVRRLIKTSTPGEEGTEDVRIAIPFSVGDRVRVKEGYFQNFEGDVDSIDAANGRVTVMINIFGRSTPVELQHWQMERL